MELVKNIFFNTDKLIENATVKISYTGVFFQNDCDKVFVHYGFGNSWDNLGEIEMSETELGFQAEIFLSSSEPLNLCFRNDKDDWDNNNSNNYSFNIEPIPTQLMVIDENPLTYPRKLRKTYLWSKKIKLAIYKVIKYFPKLISGNYTRKRESEN